MPKRYNKIDLIFLTGSPSFYKINLFNKIGKEIKVKVIFCGYDSNAVNINSNSLQAANFEYEFLYNGDITKRNKLLTFIRLLKIINKTDYRYIIREGWYIPEYIISSFISKKNKNATVCESTIAESSINGIKGLIKKLIVNRSSIALPSGVEHKELFLKLGYKGEILLTHGVGIINKKGIRPINYNRNKPLRYLYVGRLTKCKNLNLLIETFNENGKYLTIAGNGEEGAYLKSISNNNINFTGYIDNELLGKIFKEHDVLILASLRDTWGIVVEEAIYHGLPVIVSDQVGCKTEMVTRPKTGVIFENNNKESLKFAISDMEDSYDIYKQDVKSYDIDNKDKQQVEAYISIIK